MTLPVSSGSFITAADYNDIYTLVSEVIGPGDNGYGLNLIYSQPISDRYTATRDQWTNLQYDLNTAYIHITNTSTANTVISTTTTITASFVNEMWDAANFVLANRYTCHPTQYIDTVTNTTLYTENGVSERSTSTSWGNPLTSPSITHQVNVVWASRLVQRYFFNTGGELVWLPYHTGESTNPDVSLNDLDTAWANFINYVQSVGGWNYDRDTFETYLGSTSTVYNSGTLQISILADRETDRSIRFTCTLTNLDSPGLEVAPTTKYYNIIV
jgi:hypothetical protein